MLQSRWCVLKIKFNEAWSEWVVYHSDRIETKNYYAADKDDAIATRDVMRDHELKEGRNVEYVGYCPGGIQFFHVEG